ncbi:MAG: prolyl oligopeptidase family serine peptidase [Planctomycetaceae bacterium]|nr:prolyl oligopeptidase family serine peptidase [Planctomycetaceae bacterium]
MNHFKSLRWLIVCAAFVCSPDTTTGQRLYRNSVDLQPVDDGTYWYVVQTGKGRQQFIHVDPESGTRRLAFDHKLVAMLLEQEIGKPVDPEVLPIRHIQFEADALILTGDSQSWRFSNKDKTLTKTSQAANNWLIPRPRRVAGQGPETSFTLTNELEESVRVEWIASADRVVKYADLAPNQSMDMSTYAQHAWLLSTSREELGAFFVRAADTQLVLTKEVVDAVKTMKRNPAGRPRRGSRTSRPFLSASRSGNSPDGDIRIEVRDDNLWRVQTDDNSAAQLTSEASAGHTFRRDASRSRLVNMQYNRSDYPPAEGEIYWSPDSSRFVAFQSTRVRERRVTYVRSLPAGSTAPQVESYPYAKPGDALPVATPRLFRRDGSELALSSEMISNPFDLQFKGWSPDGKTFYLLYNERGHQRLSYLAVDATTGTMRRVIDEQSDTFIHYSDSGKMVLRHLSAGQILWASERSGWNHLYLYSESGSEATAVTSGEWNVRRIANIDQKKRQIWFYAVGIQQDQDPYHEHYCRVNYDGSELTILTAGDGTHTVTHTADGKWLLDQYSRVDLPPVHELRRADNGELVVLLEEADASEVEQALGSLPIRFHAPGRDGKTEIWGLMHLPKDFDPEQKYAVVENIYAGPHDHHVPKAFRTRYGHQREIANRGAVVVQIDGMGTAWRSKDFHDVCHKNLRDAGFPDRIAWLKAAASRFPYLDISRVGIYGGSAGGQNAMAALLWHGDFYSAAVADCGCHDNRVDKLWWNEQWMGWPVDQSYINSSNVENAERLQGHLMLVVGECDRNVDPASTTQVAARLIAAGKDFDYLLIPGAGHGCCESPYGRKRRIEFLTQHLKIDSKQ